MALSPPVGGGGTGPTAVWSRAPGCPRRARTAGGGPDLSPN